MAYFFVIAPLHLFRWHVSYAGLSLGCGDESVPSTPLHSRPNYLAQQHCRSEGSSPETCLTHILVGRLGEAGQKENYEVHRSTTTSCGRALPSLPESTAPTASEVKDTNAYGPVA